MADLGNRTNVNSAIDLLLDDLAPDGSILPSDHNGLLKDILDTLANGLSVTLRTGNTTSGQNLQVTSGDSIQFDNSTFLGSLSSATLTGNQSYSLPDKSGTIALTSEASILAVDSQTLGGNFTHNLNSNTLTLNNGVLNITNGGFGVLGSGNVTSDGIASTLFSFINSSSQPIMIVQDAGNVSIGTSVPDVSAKLEIDSTTQGFLKPRMTTTQRDLIGAPALGLEIFNTTTGQTEFWDGVSWGGSGASYGIVARYDSSGKPTFYASLSSAITSASSGDTIQIYSDITETGAVTITCKNGVNINFNGFTYTLNNASTDNAFSVPTGVSMEMFNGKVLRTGGTGSSSNSLAIHTTGTGTFKANNMVFESDFGTAGYIGSSDRSFYGGTFYSSDRGFFVAFGSLYNAICNGGTGAGIQIQNSGGTYNCEGYSSGSYGIYNNASNAYFCVGRSDGDYGYWGAGGNSHDCKGYSTANVGANISSNGSFSNIYGFSSSSRGVSILGNGVGVIGYSTASQGVYYSNGAGSSHVIQDVKATSTAAAGLYILLNAGKVEFSNLDVGSRWNNASGHGIIVSGSDNDVILNGGSIRVENASANCLYNSAAKSCYFNTLSFVNSTTAVNANITNLQTNTPDAYGNILVG